MSSSILDAADTSLRPLTPPTAAPPTPRDARSASRQMLPVAAVAAVLGLSALAARLGGALEHTRAPVSSHVVSGTPSFRSTESGIHERWPSGGVTVVLDPSLDAIDPDARDAVSAAFGTWITSDAALPPITFDRATEPGVAAHDGVNRVVVEPITIPGHEKDVAVTIAYADSASGRILEADIVLNSLYAFGDAKGKDDADVGDEDHPPHCASKTYDVQGIATHEVGHFFGLGEDMKDTKATMYFRSAPCETHKRGLAKGDESAMTALYAANVAGGGATDPNAPVVAPAGCSIDPRGQGRGGVSAVALVAAAALVARRRRTAS